MLRSFTPLQLALFELLLKDIIYFTEIMTNQTPEVNCAVVERALTDALQFTTAVIITTLYLKTIVNKMLLFFFYRPVGVTVAHPSPRHCTKRAARVAW